MLEVVALHESALAQSGRSDALNRCPLLGVKRTLPTQLRPHTGDVQNEHAAARSFVIDTDENVFKNTNGCGTQSGLGIVNKRAQITPGAPQCFSADGAPKGQKRGD